MNFNPKSQRLVVQLAFYENNWVIPGGYISPIVNDELLKYLRSIAVNERCSVGLPPKEKQNVRKYIYFDLDHNGALAWIDKLFNS